MDIIVIGIYIVLMIVIGWYAKSRAKSQSDFLVAGRRLGPVLYTATMGALVMGGASTVGGVGLGYQYGISGVWMVFSIALGLLLISLLMAGLINRLGVYTIPQMLELRYGLGASIISGVVILAYTFMIAVTSTIAYGAILGVLFGISKVSAILLGGSVVVFYSTLGGMWSITLTDFVQFVVKTFGFLFLLLPAALIGAGGFEGLHANLPDTAFSLTHIGLGTMISYFILFILSMLVGQDIWQRVFTARSSAVAKWGGVAAAVYCFCYALAGSLIGMSAKVVLPAITDRDQVYVEAARLLLPVGLTGLVVAAALAAVMSTSSGALIAAATVAKEDILRTIRHRGLPSAAALGTDDTRQDLQEVRTSRGFVLIIGVLMLAAAASINDVVAGFTIACAILIAGPFVAIVGGIVWKRATIKGALASIIVGIALTFGGMAVMQDIYANLPIYAGFAGSFVAFIVGSLLDRPTPAPVVQEWNARTQRDADAMGPADVK